MEETISVIIPVYNVEKYLKRCLDSVLNNTYRNLEVICVDDGSPDKCPQILDDYARRDDRILVIHKENGGISSARNAGLDAATGAYIAFVDSDDAIHCQYFEILMDLHKRNHYDFTMCDYWEIKSDKKPPDVKIEGQCLELNLLDVFSRHYTRSYVWGKLYRRELLEKVRFVEGVAIAEDAAFNGLAFASQERLKASYLKSPIYFYYRRESSLSQALGGENALTLAEIFETYAEQTESPTAKYLYLVDTVKRAMGGRYLLSLEFGKQEKGRAGSNIAKRAMRKLWKLPNTSLKEKLIYTILVYSPWLYRQYRLWEDPTLRQMEKRIKCKK